MLVFWKQRLVIFSVPKTGTSAFDKTLAPLADISIINPPILKHMPVYRFNRFMTPLFDAVNSPKMERFAVVREPLDWLGSWYRYRKRPELDGTSNSTKSISFDQFVLDAMKGKQPAHANVGSQVRFLSGGTGSAGVDHLFQYEQLDLACAFLKQRLGCELPLDRVNVSPPETLELSAKTMERYRRKKADEFELWKSAHR